MYPEMDVPRDWMEPEMDPENKVIREEMEQAVRDGVFPGGVLLAVSGGVEVFSAAAGKTGNRPEDHPVMTDTVYDLASLTKPLATVPAVMYLVAKERIDLEAPVASILKDELPPDKKSITWRHLLSHTSGLPAYRPYFETLCNLPQKRRKQALIRLIADEPLVSRVGEKALYSDIGFLLLQYCIEAVTDMAFAAFVTRKVYPGLNVSGLYFPSYKSPLKMNSVIAATEQCAFRGLLRGVVHDENAFAIGGAAGHAGLFGNTGAVAGLLRQFMGAYAGRPAGTWLTREIAAHFLQPDPVSGRTVGFDRPLSSGSSAGRYFDPDHSAGHLGFTGTSFWMELKRRIIVVLLTNRVHPSRLNETITRFRPYIHDRVMELLLRK